MRLTRTSAVAIAAGVAGVALSACSAGGRSTGSAARTAGAVPAAATSPTTGYSYTTPSSARPAATTLPAPTTPPTTAVPAGWRVVSTTAQGAAVEERNVTVPGGDQVVLLRFLAGRTSFALHVGSSDPPVGNAVIPASAGSVITAAERPYLLAAFNGGFKTSTYSGGVEVDGVVLKPLVTGEASLVIDTNGAARVAVWGSGAPLAGESVASVRQNLPPLVTAGQASSAINVISAWGATIRGYTHVARSALCSDSAGNLVYAGSGSAVPADLSTALIDAGCVTAMEMDINPYWVMADVAATPGGPLSATVPGQNQSATQYLNGWSRDFVTVLAAP